MQEFILEIFSLWTLWSAHGKHQFDRKQVEHFSTDVFFLTNICINKKAKNTSSTKCDLVLIYLHYIIWHIFRWAHSTKLKLSNMAPILYAQKHTHTAQWLIHQCLRVRWKQWLRPPRKSDFDCEPACCSTRCLFTAHYDLSWLTCRQCLKTITIAVLSLPLHKILWVFC